MHLDLFVITILLVTAPALVPILTSSDVGGNCAALIVLIPYSRDYKSNRLEEFDAPFGQSIPRIQSSLYLHPIA